MNFHLASNFGLIFRSHEAGDGHEVQSLPGQLQEQTEIGAAESAR